MIWRSPLFWRVPLGFIVFMILWVGAAQLGVALLGPDSYYRIIIFAVVGMFAGVGAAFRIIIIGSEPKA